MLRCSPMALCFALAACGGPPAPPPVERPPTPEPAPEAPTAASHYDAAQRALEANDSADAERHLRTALTMPALDPSSELAWRIRSRLATVLAGDGRPEEAREIAGLLCEGLDGPMIPPFMGALITEIEAADVCGGVCRRLLPCCRAFVAEMNRATGGTTDVEQTCAPLGRLGEDGTMSDEVCQQVLEGWRQALGAMPGSTVPAVCGS